MKRAQIGINVNAFKQLIHVMPEHVL